MYLLSIFAYVLFLKQYVLSISLHYCAEHKIATTDTKANKGTDTSFLCFYEETEAEQYVPRNLMVDLESNIIDDVKSSSHVTIFDPEFLLSRKEQDIILEKKWLIKLMID